MFAIAAVPVCAQAQQSSTAKLKADALFPQNFESALPTLAVSAALGLFAACVQRL
jgi:hypothetical protein